MDTTDVTRALPKLLTQAGLPPDPAREVIRIWARSGVERLRFAAGSSLGASVVLKYAEHPFDREERALRYAARGGLPVPRVHAAHSRAGLLTMLLEDLGDPIQEATDTDGAAAAVALHQISGHRSGLPALGEAELTSMPGRILARLAKLDLASIAIDQLHALEAAASSRAAGAAMAPFGLCHSEYHLTSVHIGQRGRYLLDFARAFVGPGLLDMASWHGTLRAPDPDRLYPLLEDYVAYGGPAHTLTRRGGLPAQRWALGWHRVWVADWFAEQIERGWAREKPQAWINAITRHLNDAADLLAG
ncbi:hypothetical protein ACWEJ6_51475 [Nonomuraea sp. NPDC004702]